MSVIMSRLLIFGSLFWSGTLVHLVTAASLSRWENLTHGYYSSLSSVIFSGQFTYVFFRILIKDRALKSSHTGVSPTSSIIY